MSLSNAHKKIAIQRAKEEALKQMKTIIYKGLALQMELVMLIVLHDKFGFGAKRCAKALEEFEELWDSINLQRLSLDDVKEVVEKEIGLVVNEDELKIVTPEKKKAAIK